MIEQACREKLSSGSCKESSGVPDAPVYNADFFTTNQNFGLSLSAIGAKPNRNENFKN